jgi:hypothetical protein
VTSGRRGDPVVQATLDEAAAVGWSALTLEAVARRAKTELGGLLLDVPTKAALLRRYTRSIDMASLEGVAVIDHESSPRDRLFDVMMQRFDALNQHRKGARAIVSGLTRDPLAAAVALCHLRRSMAATLEAAGISTAGLKGCARVQGLQGLYLAVLRTWMNDDSSDLAKTMATLDRALNRAERLAGLSPFSRHGSSPEDQKPSTS